MTISFGELQGLHLDRFEAPREVTRGTNGERQFLDEFLFAQGIQFADSRTDSSADSSVLQRSRKKFACVRPRVSVVDVPTTF